ncbi:hypothetical protein AB0H43_07635 [Hamadaea sp. NPDC050747]|uniref:hypothetical protein n=1 Tax=Hamadaea sp. NPDC050747 TaxID=3155789 RepID=UPI0033D2DDC6
MAGRHQRDSWPQWRWVRWLADRGVSTRSVALVIGVLLLQAGFIASYLAAFHEPEPHEVAVVTTNDQVAQQLNGLSGDPLKATVVADRAAAVQKIDDQDAYGAYVVGPQNDELIVASAAGVAVTTTLEEIFGQLARQTGRKFTVTDVKPLPSGDPRGLSGFYLVVGWTVGGYLVASALSVSLGARPSTRQRAVVRLGALAAYALVSGIVGAWISYAIVGGMPHHYVGLAALGALLVFGVGAATMALQVVSGIVGIGLAVLLFVILGNPSAGGAYAWPLLPGFWRAIGPWLPPGAGLAAFRSIVYFGNSKLLMPLLVLAAYAVVGAVATLLLAGRRPHLATEIDEFGAA